MELCIKYVPYFPPYFFNVEDILNKSQNDADRNTKVEEYYHSVIKVTAGLEKLTSDYPSSLSDANVYLCSYTPLTLSEIEQLATWLLSPPFYHEFKSSAEQVLKDGAELEEKATARSRVNPEFNIILKSGLNKEFPRVFADAKQHFLANFINGYYVLVDMEGWKTIQGRGTVRYYFNYKDHIYVADRSCKLTLYRNGEKDNDFKPCVLEDSYLGLSSVESKAVIFNTHNIVVIDLEELSLSDNKVMRNCIEIINIQESLKVEKVALSSMGLAYVASEIDQFNLLKKFENPCIKQQIIISTDWGREIVNPIQA